MPSGGSFGMLIPTPQPSDLKVPSSCSRTGACDTNTGDCGVGGVGGGGGGGMRPAYPGDTLAHRQTISHLEGLACDLVRLFNSHNFSHPHWQRCSPALSTWFETHRSPSRDDHLFMLRLFMTENPDFHLAHIKNVSASVDEKRGKAEVWIATEISGYNGTSRETVDCSYWTWRGEEWVCYRIQGMTGLGFV